jgi:hypothetical protein
MSDRIFWQPLTYFGELINMILGVQTAPTERPELILGRDNKLIELPALQTVRAPGSY